MPAGKRAQINTMYSRKAAAQLYTLITFVGLFILTTTLVVIYYVKAEGYRTEATTLRGQRDELASSAEMRKIGALVGSKQPRKSRLGQMADYLDQMVSLALGGVPEETSAEVKVETAGGKAKEVFERLDIGTDATAGLIRIVGKLQTDLDNATDAELSLRERLQELQDRFDDAMATGAEKEQTLLAEKEKYQRQTDEIRENYNELQALMEQTSAQQVKMLSTGLDEERANSKKLHQELLKTQAELKMARARTKRAQEKLQALVPPPDVEVAAARPDGKIILIDDRAKIVHISIGSNDHVYRGLTFSVYDRNMPIPRDGRGKAEVEVFNVGKNISAARIIRSEIKKTIVLDDIVANLIWDSSKTNVFVVAGEFDLDGDGNIDTDAVDKIKALIDRWGGAVAETVSIDTDFVVLGGAPRVRQKPTFEEMQADLMAMGKYEAALQKLADYKHARSQAQTLSIPVFNAERFFFLIGYEARSGKAGAF